MGPRRWNESVYHILMRGDKAYSRAKIYSVRPTDLHIPYYTSIKIIKNEVGCRDDTVPIQEATVRRSESMQQSSAIPKN